MLPESNSVFRYNDLIQMLKVYDQNQWFFDQNDYLLFFGHSITMAL